MSPKSKRVSQVDNPLDHALGRPLQLDVHGEGLPGRTGVVTLDETIRPDRRFGDQMNLPGPALGWVIVVRVG